MSVANILGELVEILDTGNVKLIPPSEDVNMEKKIKTIYPTPNSTLRVKLSSEEVNTSAPKDLHLSLADQIRKAQRDDQEAESASPKRDDARRKMGLYSSKVE